MPTGGVTDGEGGKDINVLLSEKLTTRPTFVYISVITIL